MTGLRRLAANASMYKTARIRALPPNTVPFAPQRATVPVEGSHSHQGGDLPAVQGPQLRQVRQKGEGDLLPHARDGAQEVVLLTPYGTLTESLP